MNKIWQVVALAVVGGGLVVGCGPTRRDPTTSADALRSYGDEARARHRPVAATGGSLWSPSAQAMYTDFKARRIGDIVIIHVEEETDAASSAATSSQRKADASAGVSRLFGLEMEIGFIKDLVSAGGDTSHKGAGSTSRKNSIETTVAARVIDVMPNETLLIEARRRVSFNHDSQIVRLLGIVRAVDIDAAGAVSSTRVSDLQLLLDGKGVVDEAEKPAWLYRLLTRALPI